MKKLALIGVWTICLALRFHGVAAAFELEPGINAAGIIKYPTALNQPTSHTFHTTIELTDVGEPDLNLYNLRYGFQLGNFQLLTDLNYAIEPLHEFDYGEVKGKIQLLNLEEFRFAIALGLLGRFVQDKAESQARIDDKGASLLVVSSIELFPFGGWGGFLLNFYLDNRVFVLGLKTQLYTAIQLVAEGEMLHSTTRDDDRNFRAGISIDGGKNLYFQFLFTDQGENFLIQIGGGF